MLSSGVASAQAEAPIVRLSIQEPTRHNARGGILDGRDFNIEFRVTAPEALGFVELVGNGEKEEALVLSDTDDCLEFDLGHPTLTGPFQTSCGDGIPDEVFIPFRVDPNDRPAVRDTDFCGSDRDRLDDDPDTTLLTVSNKAYLLAPNQLDLPAGVSVLTPLPVGPSTGGEMTGLSPGDCYGYGADEDLPGLVVMADVGAARVFNSNFDLLYPMGPGIRRIRNLAGFTSTVTREAEDRSGRSHIVAHMQVERGMLEPLVAFDFLTGGAFPWLGGDFARRIDSGPIETFAWDPAPAVDFSTTPARVVITNDVYNQLLATLPDSTSVKVRAVLVEGPAPDFIDDMNGDGRFTIVDLVQMGYTPLSNQAVRTFNIQQEDKFADLGDGLRCPSRSVVVGLDLDTNPLDDLGYFCNDGDGSSRSFKRVRR